MLSTVGVDADGSSARAAVPLALRLRVRLTLSVANNDSETAHFARRRTSVDWSASSTALRRADWPLPSASTTLLDRRIDAHARRPRRQTTGASTRAASGAPHQRRASRSGAGWPVDAPLRLIIHSGAHPKTLWQ